MLDSILIRKPCINDEHDNLLMDYSIDISLLIVMDTKGIRPSRKMIEEHEKKLRNLCIYFVIWFTVTFSTVIIGGKSSALQTYLYLHITDNCRYYKHKLNKLAV